jgi:nucleotide-binding universal stress UspA family protein
MNSTHTSRSKIIWAIDPFEEPLKSKSQLLSTLVQVSQKQEALVEPVYVLNLAVGLNAEPRPLSTLSHLSQYKHGAEKAVHAMIQGIEGVEFLAPHVLLAEDSSPAELAQQLAAYAKTTHARCILVGTHARHGLPRVLLGSFTETLILSSDLPVITIGPACLHAASAAPKQILFATDLEDNADEVYLKLRNFAKASDLEITLYYSVPPRLEPVFQSMTYLISGGWVSVPESLTEEEQLKRKKAEKWAEEARERGVILNIHFEVSPGNIPDLVVEYAKLKKFPWIAIGSESGALKAALIGSIVREVVRNAPCPVWVMRTPQKSNDTQRKSPNEGLIPLDYAPPSFGAPEQGFSPC